MPHRPSRRKAFTYRKIRSFPLRSRWPEGYCIAFGCRQREVGQPLWLRFIPLSSCTGVCIKLFSLLMIEHHFHEIQPLTHGDAPLIARGGIMGETLFTPPLMPDVMHPRTQPTMCYCDTPNRCTNDASDMDYHQLVGMMERNGNACKCTELQNQLSSS